MFAALAPVRVAIPALPIGNLAAVANMIRKCGGEPVICGDPREMVNSSHVIIAGVGAFDAGMQSLHSAGWVDALNDLVAEGQAKVLGICLGMQLMCVSSEEGAMPGLGWFDARVTRFSSPHGSNVKIPHMGWNTVEVANPCPLLDDEPHERRYYFSHSYHLEMVESTWVMATATHGYAFPSVIAQGNLYGVQFHPEKSHRFGAKLIANFVRL